MIGRRAAGLVVAVALVGACTGGGGGRPGPRPDAGASTTVIDRSGIVLAGVPGQTTSTILERGTASITGTVRGPAGPVAGGTVRIERLVAGREVRTDVVSDASGAFTLGEIPGGRYRVRAFLAPTLAQVVPEVRFLVDGEKHTFDLVVEEQSGLVVRTDVAPEPPLLGRDVNLVALVATRVVDADGVVRSTPVTGAQVELTGLGRWVLRDDTPSSTTTSTTSSSVPLESTTTTTSEQRPAPSALARTDRAGQVRYELRCESPGTPGLSLRVFLGDAQPVVLDLPDCVDPATTTTTTATSSTTRP
ncbi:MAG: carboxypeptidase regulatory-like domain-containing protein [Microthrixaceae bacterium]